jgi:hypothetical protein
MINNSNKKIVSNIVGGLLLGGSVALTVPVQASQQHSRDSRVPQPRRNVQENRERKNEPVGLTKEELAEWAKKSPEERKEWMKKRKKIHNKNQQQNREFHARATKNMTYMNSLK